MVLPHYLRSTEIDIPNNKEQQSKNINIQDLFSPESPELDVPLLLPRDSEALDVSRYNTSVQNNQSSFDWTEKEHGSSSFQDAKVESLPQHTQIDGLVDQAQPENMSDQRLPSQTGPRTSCHCQVSSV